ncbi:MAG TPA: glycosyltransferase family 2 protein [Blastocatellia bacterium]|nr:glycosyltransferase family 2 protein [Blastocatellia bacterium]
MNGSEHLSTVAPETGQTEPPNREQSDGPVVSDSALSAGDGELAEIRLQLNQRDKELLDVKRRLWATKHVLIQKENELNKIMGTLGWRLLSRYGPVKYRYVVPLVVRLRKMLGRDAARKGGAPALEPQDGDLADSEPDAGSYQDWAARCEKFRYDSETAQRRVEDLRYKPLISIIVPVYNPPLELLRKAIESVRGQFYPAWELCLCDDASTDPEIRGVLKEYAASDKRIKILFAEKNGGIARASNLALGLATGEFVGLLDDDDELTPDALLEVATTLQETEADLIYSDEDKLDLAGARCDAFMKPAWSPDLMLSCNYVCHFGVYRKKLVDQIGGFREGFDGSQDYDLVLRFSEKTDRIAHIPKILYHWRKRPGSAASSLEAKPYAYEASCNALTEALARRGIRATVEGLAARGFHRVRRCVRSPGKVSIIIPTRDRLHLLRRCIASIEAKTEYDDYEIIIVDNDSCDVSTVEYLETTRHRVIHDQGPFNFSRLNNLAANAAGGRYLVLLNNDTEIISPEWLSAMMEQAQRPEVGAVGAKLLYPDGLIQHAGVILGLGGVGNHSQRYVDGRQGGGYFNFPNLIMNYSAVTAACMMVRRELYNAMGGLNDKDLAVAFNDVDFCLRLRREGYLIVFTPYSVVYHHESASRGHRVNMREAFYMMENWHDQIVEDPYYNPSLTRDGEGFTIDLSKPEALSCIYQQESSNEAVPVTEERCIGQYFFSAWEHLSAIGVYFATYRRKCAGTVRFHLRESHQGGPDIAVCEADASEIRDNSFFTFSFQPIHNSAGKMFYFFVEYPPQAGQSPLSIWKASITNEIIGPYYAGHNAAVGTLCFKAYCHLQSRCATALPAARHAS